MKITDLPLHRQALAALEALSEVDRRRILLELVHWWPQPRNLWPTDRLLQLSPRPNEELFCIDDRWAVTIRWHEQQPVEITSLRRRQVEIVSTEPPRSVWRNPDVLLAGAVLAFAEGMVCLVLFNIMVVVPNKMGRSEPSFSAQVLSVLSWLGFLSGIGLLMVRLFRGR